MKVLHVYKGYYPQTIGGMCEVIRQLALGLKRHGVDNRVFCLSPTDDPLWLDRPEGRVLRCRSTVDWASTPLSLRAFGAFAEQVRWADVVHYHFPWPFADLLHLATGVTKPTVVSYQSDIVRQKWLGRLYRPLMMRFLRSVDAVVTTSPQYLATSEVLQSLGRPVQVIPNGIDEATLPPPTAQTLQAWRERVGEGFALFVGAWRYYKGLEVLLAAARQTTLPVVIAGEGTDAQALARQVADLPPGRVRFIGRIGDDDKAALLSLCRMFVFPSNRRSEAFGVSLVEASRFGRPMITCEIGTGTSFVNIDGQTGIVAPPDDASALAAAIERLRQDRPLADRMGQSARRRYEEGFSASRMARDYFGLYESIRKR